MHIIQVFNSAIVVCPGMTEPVYKAKEFLTPEQIEKNLTRDLAERKYRNM